MQDRSGRWIWRTWGMFLVLYNAASSPATRWNLFLIVLIGMPLVISYTAIVYCIFRGKVKFDDYG